MRIEFTGHWIEIEHGRRITSNLKDGSDGLSMEDEDAFCNAIDGLESLILAHAAEGIDVTSPQYVSGVESAVFAVEAIHNLYQSR